MNEKTFETSVEGVFSGGDVVTGAATAIEAIAAGRKAAYAIDTLHPGGRRPAGARGVHQPQGRLRQGRHEGPAGRRNTKPKRHIPMLPVDQRVEQLRRGRAGLLGGRPARGDHPVPRVRLHGAVRLRPPQVRDRVRRRREALPRRGAAARARHLAPAHRARRRTSASCAAAASASAATSSACRPTASSTAASAPWWRPRSAGRCSTPSACRCGLCIGTCPTGAIAQHLPLAKPGPWKTESAESVCHYCGVGCRINYDAFGDTLVKVSRNEANEVTFGNHCRKGRFGFNFVHAQDRLLTGRVRVGASRWSTPRSTRRSPTRRRG